MINEPASMRLARIRRCSLELRLAVLLRDAEYIKDDLHLIEMLQVSHYGGCPHCQNAHYPHCEVLDDE